MSGINAIGGEAVGGTLYGIGVGPGDVRYLTLRAAALIEKVDVIAYFAKRGRVGNARTIVTPILRTGLRELRLEYPLTDQIPAADPAYQAQIHNFYEASASEISAHLADRQSVGLLSEGDPFFYGSFMHMWRRLKGGYPVEVVPGVTGMSGCWTRANQPITWGDDILTVLPGTLDVETLAHHLAVTDAAVIMKLGRNLSKVRHAITRAGLLSRAIYVERGTMESERVAPLAEVADDSAPYFSVVIIPGNGRRL